MSKDSHIIRLYTLIRVWDTEEFINELADTCEYAITNEYTLMSKNVEKGKDRARAFVSLPIPEIELIIAVNNCNLIGDMDIKAIKLNSKSTIRNIETLVNCMDSSCSIKKQKVEEVSRRYKNEGIEVYYNNLWFDRHITVVLRDELHQFNMTEQGLRLAEELIKLVLSEKIDEPF